MRELTARVENTIHASPSEVWVALTTPATLKKFFFGAEISTDWVVGSAIRMTGAYQGKSYEDKGKILVIEPQQRLSFSHWSAMSGKPDVPENYHVVTFELTPDGAQTRVALSQTNLYGGVTQADIAHRAEYEKNWAMVLDGLAKLFA